ncbi:MAG: guanylate kinase [Candidatus Aquicultor secundus]|uniref:Guanylate kinase n=1 Tax=Candidatus Aquicultor secundus TaxID=1973895 RepID=A0A2M7T9V2_9ACTN|nr:guanylate kinase [Candidatus Aquicultor secundus]NCO65914.1 guanylate kinase [Solirubrobacter sp.]OIO86388.1 MAG: guanylate kinase [Candidatus Aquicultor secundus]PIW22234.1 MAG: guanylate kinase [Candidatus Aquicultor secundus]PIX51429.1 MAG: guanylate kinase [Candidatus Aquicultor secundus]PIY41113.1 MAG: guanylate kinase [Candidatus Aquicultor secundus]
MDSDPKVFVISGPSGAGKGTLTDELLKRVPSLTRSVSATTRKPRPGEVNGVDYYFLDEDEFKDRIFQGGFLEWAMVHGNYYGTLKSVVKEEFSSGKDVVMVIDVQGAASIKEKMPEAVLIFIEPPSIAELVQRLKLRNTETTAELQERLKNAETEMGLAGNYDYVVINDDVERAVDELVGIVKAEKRANKSEGDN